MCTFVVLRRPGHHWPVLIAANRDEMVDRPWLPPARHWPDRPEVVAGLDKLAGGSWLGVNDDGMVAAVMNRQGTLGPESGRRSRGELVLEALDHAEASVAAEALAYLNPNAYRSFNLVVADFRDAFWLRHVSADGPEHVEVFPLPSGLSMFTAHDRNDLAAPRIRLYLPRFEVAETPDPDQCSWSAWEALLASRESEGGYGPYGAMTVITETGFGTVSSSLIALPAPDGSEAKPLWRFCAGPPGRTPYSEVVIS